MPVTISLFDIKGVVPNVTFHDALVVPVSDAVHTFLPVKVQTLAFSLYDNVQRSVSIPSRYRCPIQPAALMSGTPESVLVDVVILACNVADLT